CATAPPRGVPSPEDVTICYAKLRNPAAIVKADLDKLYRCKALQSEGKWNCDCTLDWVPSVGRIGAIKGLFLMSEPEGPPPTVTTVITLLRSSERRRRLRLKYSRPAHVDSAAKYDRVTPVKTAVN